MRSSWLRLFAVLMAFGLIAAACGSDSDSGDSASVDAAEDARAAAEAAQAEAEAALEEAEARAAEAEAAAEAAAGGDSTPADDRPFVGEIVRVSGPERSPEDWESLEVAFDVLEERTGMTIIYTGSADWESEINVQLAAGNPPDISIFPQPGKLADFARDDLILPLPDDVMAEVEANWGAGAIGFGTVDGVQFGVPNKNDLKSLVWYKPAVFEANGWAIPQTWDEFIALTDTIIASGEMAPLCVGIESGTATGWTFTDWVEDMMLRFQGPEVYDQWVTNEVKFSDPGVQEVFQTIIDLWNKEGAVYASGGSIAATPFAAGNAEALIDEQCAMVRQASFFSGFLPDGTSDQVSVFYFPALTADERPVLGAGTLAGAFTDSPAVWEVMKYFATPEYANVRQAKIKELKTEEGQDESMTLSGFNTANLNVDRELWAPLEQGFIEILQNAAVFRFDGSDLMPADVGAGTFWTESTALVNGEKTVAEATEAIDASWPSE
ncbi:MAG: carbohydrate ABC transporter substrate-binding protein [Acidimicrobiales bacterium]|nr:carbohydrate ABC transporter substrate-binding protein [Acidimicrobiales bacterium]